MYKRPEIDLTNELDIFTYLSVGRKSHKWWHSLLWFFIYVSILNAHILEHQADTHWSRTQLIFIHKLSGGGLWECLKVVFEEWNSTT